MKVIVKSGDILDEICDVIVCSANVQLNLSGGVGGALLLRAGPQVQADLHQRVRATGKTWLEPGSIVVMPSPLKNAKFVVHAIAIDPFYASSVALVTKTLGAVLRACAELDAQCVAVPALATGFGPLCMEEFAQALAGTLRADFAPVTELRVVLCLADDVRIVEQALVI